MASKISVLLLTIFLNILNTPGNATNFPDPSTHRNWHLVNPPNCGTTRLTDKIIGGYNASIGEFPWMAAINFTVPDWPGDTVHCGGSIINENYVLTAGHCFEDEIPYNIIIGELSKDTDPDCEGNICAPNRTVHEMESYLVNEIWNATYIHNKSIIYDVALIRVKPPIVFNEFVRPICLPYGNIINKDYVGETALRVSGWGFTTTAIPKFERRYPRTLKAVEVPVIPCKKTIDSLICAGKNGSDTCYSDSGGALVKVESVNNGTAKFYEIGVTNRAVAATDCDRPPYYGGYMNVAAIMSWLLDNIH